MRRSATPNPNSGLLSDTGRQRGGGVNQDAALALELPGGGLYAVADGMGGHAAGELASNIALDALQSAYLKGRGRPPERLAQAVQAANLAVMQRATGQASGMGTTLITLVLDGAAAIVGHVGDSRAYLLRGGELQQLTEDHSWVAEQVRLGLMTPQEAQGHQWRNIVSNALGGEEQARMDLFGFVAQRGDRLLLCSDGLTVAVADADIKARLTSHPDPSDAARALVQAANEAGGPDNITVIVVDVQGQAARPAYALPPRLEGGPFEVGVYLNSRSQRGPLAYVALTVVYLTLLGMVLYPERRVLVGALGALLLAAVLLGMWWRRLRPPRRPPSPSDPLVPEVDAATPNREEYQ